MDVDINPNRSAVSKRPLQENASKTTPFCVRFSHEERARLEAAANGLPLGTFIRNLVLGSDVKPHRVRNRYPVKDHESLGRVLGVLGQSRLSQNLNQLAKAVHTGTLEVTPQTEAEIVAACGAVALMRADLMRALGLIEVGTA